MSHSGGVNWGVDDEDVSSLALTRRSLVLRRLAILKGSSGRREKLRRLLNEMQSGAVLAFPFFDRENSPAKASELSKFLLDRLQALLSLTVSDLGLWVVPAFASILFVQRLNLGDLGAEPSNLFAKDIEMIHTIKNNPLERLSVMVVDSGPVGLIRSVSRKSRTACDNVIEFWLASS